MFISATVPYTAYDLKIAGYTSKGLGSFSDVYPVLTDVTGMLQHSHSVHLCCCGKVRHNNNNGCNEQNVQAFSEDCLDG